MKLTVRPYTPADLPYVMDNWLNGWRTSRYAGVVLNNRYFDTTRDVIEALIARGAKINVADEGRTLAGFICFEVKDTRPVVHWLEVKDPFIHEQVDDALLASLPVPAPGFMTFFNKRLGYRGWTHAPEIARRKDL